MKNHQPNGSIEDVKLGILHDVRGFWVSNQGTKKNPKFHVWVSGLTHSVCDSAYSDISLAVCRCNYLAKKNPTDLDRLTLSTRMTLRKYKK